MTKRPTSRFYRDPEVAAFVKQCIEERLIYSTIHERCVEKFGADRAPSSSAISRFYQTLPKPG